MVDYLSQTADNLERHLDAAEAQGELSKAEREFIAKQRVWIEQTRRGVALLKAEGHALYKIEAR